MQVAKIFNADTNTYNSIKSQRNINFKQNSSLLKESIKEVKLIKDSNLDLTSRVLEKIGVKDIEYIIPRCQETVNRIFIKCKEFIYNMTLGKITDDLITGFVSKEYNNGKNELFMMRAEFLETNKSKKLQLSYIPVVQMGLEDGAEVRPKNLKDIKGDVLTKTDVQEKVVEWQETSESFNNSKLLGGLLGSCETSTSHISPASIEEKTLNNINIGIQLSNSDVKRNVTYTIDKKSNELSKTGATIGLSNNIKSPKHEDWDIVKGPYGLIEAPKSINITEEGIDPSSVNRIIKAPLEYYRSNQCDAGKYLNRTDNYVNYSEIESLTKDFIKEPKQLKNLISILTRELNGETFIGYYSPMSRETFITKAYFTEKSQINNIRSLIEVARNLLLAAEKINS